MAYVKVDTAILDSSLWQDHDACRMFLAALLLARPHRATEPMGEIGLDTLDETGLILQPGWYGLVEASAPGLIARCGLSKKRGAAALARLNRPDIQSRSKTLDGRRLLRVDGGFIIPNYMAYRDKDYTAATRMKGYRQRKKGGKVSVTRNDRNVTRNDRNVTSPVTQALALAIEDQDQKQDPGSNEYPDPVIAVPHARIERARARIEKPTNPPDTALTVQPVWNLNPRAHTSALVGRHTGCFEATPHACARGICLPTWLGQLWRQQQGLEDPGAADRYIAEFATWALTQLQPGAVGDEPKTFWLRMWQLRHGSQAPTPIQTQTKGNASVAAFNRFAAAVKAGRV